MSFLSWRRLFVPVQSSCAIFLWPLKAPAWYDFGACALEEAAKSSLVRNSILEKNWCLYEDPNSSNTDSHTHNELVTLLAVLKSCFSQVHLRESLRQEATAAISVATLGWMWRYHLHLRQRRLRLRWFYIIYQFFSESGRKARGNRWIWKTATNAVNRSRKLGLSLWILHRSVFSSLQLQLECAAALLPFLCILQILNVPLANHQGMCRQR